MASNVKSIKRYRGYMTFPLLGAETQEEFSSTVKYTGDFLDNLKRFNIFKRERLYRIEVHLKKVDREDWDVTDASVAKKLDKKELADVIQHIATLHVKSLDDEDYQSLDWDNSFVKVIIK